MSVNSSYALDEANSSEDSVPTFTPDELAMQFKLDRSIVEFLKKEPLNDGEALMVLHFQTGFWNLGNARGNVDANKKTLFDALVRSGAEHVGENAFKFATMEDLFRSCSFMRCTYLWAFYSDFPVTINNTPLSTVPIIKTMIITYYSEAKMTTLPFEFFKY